MISSEGSLHSQMVYTIFIIDSNVIHPINFIPLRLSLLALMVL